MLSRAPTRSSVGHTKRASTQPRSSIRYSNVQRRFNQTKTTAETLSAKFKDVSVALKISKPEDWYAVEAEALKTAGGADLLTYYGSLPKLLTEQQPNHIWTPWMFKEYEKSPRNFWGDPKNQRDYLNWLGQRLGYKSMDEWYSISKDVFKANHGSGLLSIYGDSPTSIVMNIMSSHRWLEWQFKQTPASWWDVSSNQARFLEFVKEAEKFIKMDDFYKLSVEALTRHGGTPLLAKNNNSAFQVLKSVYTHHQWLPWLFVQTPTGWWDAIPNQRLYLEWFKKKSGYDTMEDLYHVATTEIKNNHGEKLLAKYEDSVPKAIISVYTDHTWLPWRFVSLNNQWWDAANNRKAYLDWLSTTQKLTLEGFYSLNPDVIRGNSGGALLTKFGNSMSKLVADVYPAHKWETDKFQTFIQNQSNVNNDLGKVMMAVDVKESVLSNLKYRGTNKAMELDVFVKEYNLGFEYQGERHYFDCTVIGERDAFQGRDSEKAVACALNGITLIEVPYWWDTARASLAKSLRAIREDLIPIMKWKEGDP